MKEECSRCQNNAQVRGETNPIGRHFAKCGQENMSVQIIDCIRTDRSSEEEAEEALRYLEGVWQTRLATMKAQGNINKHNEMRNRHKIPAGIRNLLDL